LRIAVRRIAAKNLTQIQARPRSLFRLLSILFPLPLVAPVDFPGEFLGGLPFTDFGESRGDIGAFD
jgi:hypothetical protein